MSRIKQQDVDKVTLEFKERGYVFGETFGYEPGTDWPDANIPCSDTLSRFWYIPVDTTVWTAEKMRPWLASYIHDYVDERIPRKPLSIVGIELIRGITIEMCGPGMITGETGHHNFEVIGTPKQIKEIHDSLMDERITCGLFIIADSAELIDAPFKSISFGYVNVHLIEGDFFSVKKIS